MNQEQKWISQISKKLVGMTIVGVRYMTPKEASDFMWDGRAIVIRARRPNGEQIQFFPSGDDEGNGPGALFTDDPELHTIPVF